METFNLAPSRKVGDLKTTIREAILDGEINNNFEEAYAFLLEQGKKMGLSVKKIIEIPEVGKEITNDNKTNLK